MARVSLSNSAFSFLSQGAIIQEFSVGGHNLVLSFPSSEPYLSSPFFSETIGRVTNRTADGLIQELNGRSYQLSLNEGGKTHLHGGIDGWGHKIFSGPERVTRNGREAIRFTYLSPDGDEGYPGTVELRVWYTPLETDDGVATLDIEYEAELVGDECKETVVNVTNHSYFNLSENSTIDGTEITLGTNEFLVVDAHNIPTTEISTFAGISPDTPFTMGEIGPSIDHCFVMTKYDESISLDTRAGKLRGMLSAFHPSTGIHLEVSSTEPSFQFYTGDYVDVPATENCPERKARAGFCVEPARFINAVNVPEWRKQVILPKGQIWGSRIVYKAWKS